MLHIPKKNIHDTDKDCDPLHDRPVRVGATLQTQTFLNKQKYGNESQSGARSHDGLTDYWLSAATCLPACLLASEEGLCSVKLVSS
jgi:hypothetical protein